MNTDKESPVALEVDTALISALVSGVNGGIYIFALGYTAKLGIPDYPTFFGSLRFFIFSVLEHLTSVDEFFAEIKNISLIATLAQLIIIVGFIFIWLRRDRRYKMPSKVWATVLAMLFLPSLRGIVYTIPFLISIICPTILLWVFFEYLRQKKQFTNFVQSCLVFIAMAILSWSVPYNAGKLTIDLINFEKSFPVLTAANGEKQERLLWLDSEKRYWLDCENGYIRGELNEKVFVYKYATKRIFNRACR